MMPQTVPKRPMKGAVEPMVAMIAVPRAILRPACASSRDSRAATRSLTPSAGRPEERSSSPAAARTKMATGEADSARACSAARRLGASASVSRPRRAVAPRGPQFDAFGEPDGPCDEGREAPAPSSRSARRNWRAGTCPKAIDCSARRKEASLAPRLRRLDRRAGGIV